MGPASPPQACNVKETLAETIAAFARSVLPGATRSQPTGIDAAMGQQREKMARIFDVGCKNSNMLLRADHPLTGELESTARSAAELIGIDPSSVSICVFERYPKNDAEREGKIALPNRKDVSDFAHEIPEAFVNPLTGTIYISRPLLEALNYDRQMVNAVIYHELGHLLLERNLNVEDRGAIYDPIDARLVGYEHEYHCDRLAALISSLRGEDPRSIGNALAAMDRRFRELLEHLPSDFYDNNREELALAILCSHPHSDRRIRANHDLAEQLPISKVPIDPAPSRIAEGYADFLLERPRGALPFKDSFDEIHSTDFRQTGTQPLSPVLLERSPKNVSDYRTAFQMHAELEENRLRRVEPECPPIISTVLGDKCDERKISDWFTHTVQFFSETTDPDSVDMLFDELADCDANDALTILQSVNMARCLVGDTWIPQYADTEIFMALVTSMVANRFVTERSAEGTSALDILRELYSTADGSMHRFGYSILQQCPEMFTLVQSSFRAGNDAEREQLIDLLNSNRTLTESICLTGSGFVWGRYLDGPLREIQEYAQAQQLPVLFGRQVRKPVLAEELRKASLMDIYVEGSSWLPRVVLRRMDGALFSTEITTYKTGTKELLITFSDSPGADDYRQLKNVFRDLMIKAVGKEFEEYLVDGGPDSPAGILLGQLAELPYPTRDQQLQFLNEKLPLLIQEDAGRIAAQIERDLPNSADSALDAIRSLSVDDYVTLHGSEETRAEFLGPRREHHKLTRYVALDEERLVNRQTDYLFQSLYGAEFRALPAGSEKLEFVRAHYPLRSLLRDQLLLEAIDYPAVQYLDDVKQVVDKVSTEERKSILIGLRDSFQAPLVTGAAEARLFNIYREDPATFFTGREIRDEQRRVLDEIPVPLTELATESDSFRAILCCFATRSRIRDELLRPFLDAAPSRQMKEAIGSLLVDPILADINTPIRHQHTAAIESVFDVLSSFSEFERAQTLLYLLGARGFSSPLEKWMEDESLTWAEVHSGFNLPLMAPPTDESDDAASDSEDQPLAVDMPDALVRAQKAFGLSLETALSMEDTVTTNRTRHDLLWESLYGRRGIAHNATIAEQFFDAAGHVIIARNQQLSALPADRQTELGEFLSFALKRCPHDKLPTLLLTVWDASLGSGQETPELVATVLRGLGPPFVKLGQRFATLDIEPAYKQAFRKLSSQNTQIDSSLVYHNLRVLFGGNSPFDEQSSGRKIAEGSMAMTCEVTPQQPPISDREADERYAVKIIHPFIPRQIRSDVAFITELVEYVNDRPGLFGNLKIPTNTPALIESQLLAQTDTAREMENAGKIALAVRQSGLVCCFEVLMPIHNLCADGAITTPLRSSYELDNPEIERQGFNATEIRNDVGLEVLRQILTEDYYQSDVNLGNFGLLHDDNGRIVVRDGKPVVVWYDYGAVEPTAEQDQRTALRAVRILASGQQGLPEVLAEMVKGSGDADRRRAIIRASQEWVEQAEGIARTSGPDQLEVIKIYLNSYLDHLAAQRWEVEDRWLTLINTVSMATPLLKGVDNRRISELVTSALAHHGMLSTTERIFLRFWN